MRKYLDTIDWGRYLLLFIAVLPLFIFRDFTRNNELRYLSIADEAIREGHIFTFYNHGAVYADKPPLYLWLVMLGRMIFGNHTAGLMTFMSLFSVIPALFILWIMNRWVRPFVNSIPARRAGQLMLYTSVYFIGAAVVLRMDMLMCLFIVLALHTFWRIYSGASERERHLVRDRLLFPLWVFLAVFAKGPVGILVPLVTVTVFLVIKRQWRTIGRYWGWRTWGILLALCAVWFGAVYAEGGTAYLDNLLVKQTMGRAVDAFHHKAPFWYYGVSIWYSLAPWSLLAIGVLAWGLYRWRRMVTTDLERLFLVAALSTFLVLSMVSSKIQIYLLPAFPFFIYIAVLWIAKAGVRRWMLWLVGIPAGVLALTFPGLFVAAGRVDFPLLDSLFVPVAAALITVTSLVCLIWLWRGRLHTAITVLASGLLAAVFTVSFAVPLFNGYLGMGNVCSAAQAVGDAARIGRYYTYGIARAENIDVYLGRGVRSLEPAELDSVQCGIIITFKERIGTDEALTRAFAGQEVHRVGDYAFGVIHKNDE
ncbi:glycosyltransferase family 39 protein [uncultured Rikenella sp.]|uniref:ArnT family glycosyltransferase n=1 Tax=uncultured Rikenella sp. TaxID=368003 RepID=UPI002613C637|nr:glycosyltransferase family 39 protein [uncultured Rikenella sp.]